MVTEAAAIWLFRLLLQQVPAWLCRTQLTVRPESSTLKTNHLYCRANKQVGRVIKKAMQPCGSRGNGQTLPDHCQAYILTPHLTPTQAAPATCNTRCSGTALHSWLLTRGCRHKHQAVYSDSWPWLLILTALRVFICMNKLTQDSSMAIPDMDFCGQRCRARAASCSAAAVLV